MNNKAKLYVKQRDKRSKRLSPHSSDNPSEPDVESPRLNVENYGDGEIRADEKPRWPKNFEKDEEDDDNGGKEERSPRTPSSDSQEPQAGPSTNDDSPLHSKAQKYMVKTNSLRELTGTKYIAVPEPNIPNAQGKQLQLRGTASVKSYGLARSQNDIPDQARSKTVTGTFRGLPNHMSGKSHYATVRIHHNKHLKPGKIATIKPIPRNTTIRSVKGFHLGNNVTVRGHNTGHAIQKLRQAISSWDAPDGNFKRHTFAAERKEYYVSQFAIELDRPEMDVYAPGDFLSGRIILEISNNLEIRFVELLIIGLASVQFSKNDPNLSKHAQEAVLNKRSYIMGTPDGRWNSVITAGKYVSKFKFRLPDNLPSSMKYENKEKGFSFEVSYLVKARICDEMGSASARSTHSSNNYVKVLLTRRFPFMVRQTFDIHSIPNSLQPVKHSEYINLGCLPIFIDETALTLSLDRSVFLAGDEIRVKLSMPSKSAQKVRSLTCELHQHVFSNIKHRQNYILAQINENKPEGMLYNQNSKNFMLFEFVIPTSSQTIPSYMSGCQLVKVSYTVMMTVVFQSCSGQVFLECPIAIGPGTNNHPHLNHTTTTSVPIFMRPRRFPYFTQDVALGINHANGKIMTSTPRDVY